MKNIATILTLIFLASTTFAQTEDSDKKLDPKFKTVEVKTASKKVNAEVKPTEETLKKVDTKVEDQTVAELPTIHFYEEVHQFGQMEQGGKVSHTFKFKNTGSVPLTLKSVKASCGCTTPSYSKEAIEPGDEGQIDVVFNTAGKMGNQMKSITIQYGGNGPAVVYIKGEVVPKGTDSAQ